VSCKHGHSWGGREITTASPVIRGLSDPCGGRRPRAGRLQPSEQTA